MTSAHLLTGRARWSRWIAAAAVVALVAACGSSVDDLLELPDDELAEVCTLLAEGEVPEGFDDDMFDEIVERLRERCFELQIPVDAGGVGGGGPGTAGAATGGDRSGADGADRRNGTGAELDAEADPFDDDVLRRAIEAGQQCDPGQLDLSMSEVMKTPAIGPTGSPSFDAELAKQQYRAPGLCLPEPYRSQWLLVADAYAPLFDFMEAYAIASNSGFEALVGLGERAATLESDLAHLQSEEVQRAAEASERFFEELATTGAWDDQVVDEPWGQWWMEDDFQQYWRDSQDAIARAGGFLPDLPTVP